MRLGGRPLYHSLIGVIFIELDETVTGWEGMWVNLPLAKLGRNWNAAL